VLVWRNPVLQRLISMIPVAEEPAYQALLFIISVEVGFSVECAGIANKQASGARLAL